MSSKNQKLKDKFPDDLLRAWENTDGVNFAIALARLTSWLLHVDWWTPYENAPLKDMKSLRAYVGTDTDSIFDFNGKKKIGAYNRYVVLPLARLRATQARGFVLTRFYSEDDLWALPLRVKPNYADINIAMDAIKKNKAFLEKMPRRLNPHIPAHIAGKFSFGWCVVLAEAKRVFEGLPSVAIIASKFTEVGGLTPPGYVHSVNIHPDGDVEDSWGKQCLKNVLKRFEVSEYILSENVQTSNNENMKKNTPELYQTAYDEAKIFINSFPPSSKT